LVRKISFLRLTPRAHAVEEEKLPVKLIKDEICPTLQRLPLRFNPRNDFLIALRAQSTQQSMALS
jgi:hypothetical protein